MTREEYFLKSYIQNVFELEASAYQQKQLIINLQNRCNIGTPPNHGTSKSTGAMIFTGVLLCIISCICFLVPLIFSGILAGEALMVLFLLLIPLGIYLGVKTLRKAINAFREASRRATHNKQISDSYSYESDEYARKNVERQMILQELPTLQEKQRATMSLLTEFYNANVLHPDYRNLVAVCAINKYLQTGICTSLTGSNGAYSRYEYDLQMKTIINKLDIIVNQLEAIRQNQYLLYEAIQESNRISAKILSSIQDYSRSVLSKFDQMDRKLSSIDRNIEVSRYINELTRKEVAYRNYLTSNSSYRHWKY